MNTHSIRLVAALVVGVTIPLAYAQAPGGTPQIMDAAAGAEVTTITAKIEAIDQANRTITVRGPLGRSVTMPVDQAVKNFPQLKVGDELVFKYAQAMSIALTKGGEGRSKVVTTMKPETAPAGAMPGVAAGRRTTIVANVERVDTAKSMVLLQGPEGRYVELKVKDPQVMKDVKAGDQVQVTYVQAVVLEAVAPQK
jgi:hypothetical protein